MPALNGLLGNEVSVMLLNLSSVEEHAKAGNVRLIAAATQKRAPAIPHPNAVAPFCWVRSKIWVIGTHFSPGAAWGRAFWKLHIKVSH